MVLVLVEEGSVFRRAPTSRPTAPAPPSPAPLQPGSSSAEPTRARRPGPEARGQKVGSAPAAADDDDSEEEEEEEEREEVPGAPATVLNTG